MSWQSSIVPGQLPVSGLLGSSQLVHKWVAVVGPSALSLQTESSVMAACA